MIPSPPWHHINTEHENTMTHYPVKSDQRYTIQREYCGYDRPRFVLRFCGDYLASFTSYPAAVIRAVGDKAARNGALIVTEQTA
jgi:hypothetical protein